MPTATRAVLPCCEYLLGVCTLDLWEVCARGRLNMLGKLSIIGVVGAILLMPTALPAQARGAAIAGAVGRGIPTGLERHQSSHHHRQPTHHRHRTTANPRR
jgi:hypothetical protein